MAGSTEFLSRRAKLAANEVQELLPDETLPVHAGKSQMERIYTHRPQQIINRLLWLPNPSIYSGAAVQRNRRVLDSVAALNDFKRYLA